NEVLAAGDLANAVQTLHCVGDGVQQRAVGVGKATIGEPPVRQLLSRRVLGVSDGSSQCRVIAGNFGKPRQTKGSLHVVRRDAGGRRIQSYRVPSSRWILASPQAIARRDARRAEISCRGFFCRALPTRAGPGRY